LLSVVGCFLAVYLFFNPFHRFKVQLIETFTEIVIAFIPLSIRFFLRHFIALMTGLVSNITFRIAPSAMSQTATDPLGPLSAWNESLVQVGKESEGIDRQTQT
jgi:ACR3 family arsenite efflux pump ArsB